MNTKQTVGSEWLINIYTKKFRGFCNRHQKKRKVRVGHTDYSKESSTGVIEVNLIRSLVLLHLEEILCHTLLSSGRHSI